MTSSDAAVPKVRIRYPEPFGPSGRDIFRSISSNFELYPWEIVTLTEAARTADRLDRIHADMEDTDDDQRAKLLTEARLSGHHLTRLLASLRIPEETDENTVTRPQRRGGARAAYKARR
ncbi:hypothetical protein [Rhodococcus pyridinivorans]|uniref:hypothetical protein n=1 Tax=Rhodococcus pyridinivorans TaxID=103816 RepID=UPI00110E4AC7|nr:hypothetical protein [Rhodococcus pyridinivorans]